MPVAPCLVAARDRASVALLVSGAAFPSGGRRTEEPVDRLALFRGRFLLEMPKIQNSP